jgi:O-antigen ligase
MRARYNGLAAMLAGLAILFFLGTRRLADHEIDRRLAAIGAALTVASVYALIQAAGLDPLPFPHGRPASTLAHPVIFAGVLAIALPFVVLLAIDAPSRTARAWWSTAAVVQTLALVLTLARGPWVAALCGIAVFCVLAVRDPASPRRRLVVLVALTLGIIVAVLTVSAHTGTAVRARVATVASLASDSSILYRVHFYQAALAMLRDHPFLGVGWENFGLLYPIYRSPPTDTIAPDLVPTMVHSGPLQTAVSGGLPAVVLQLALLAAVGFAVVRRRRVEPDEHQRLLGAAFLASGAAYFVQDLSGWPHVGLTALAFAVWGLGTCWSAGRRLQAISRPRWPVIFLAAAVAVVFAWLLRDAARRFRAEALMFDAARLDIGKSWKSVEAKVQAALDLSPDRAWVTDAAVRLYRQRVALAGGRRTYERGVDMATGARAANPFDPYVRLERAKLDLAAMDHGLAVGLSEAGREALASAKSMTRGSAAVRTVEASMARKAGSWIRWIEPSESTGAGPRAGLTVAGSAAGRLVGTHVVLHWRNLTRGSEWSSGALVAVENGNGDWSASIPDADAADRYEVFSASEAWSWGPCTYAGGSSISLCSPVAFIGPDASGTSIMMAGSVPSSRSGAPVVVSWRNATRRAAWNTKSLVPGSPNTVSFLANAPGSWYAVVPGGASGEAYETYVSSASRASEPCTYPGDGVRTLCSPITWIQPEVNAGFGTPASLVVAGAIPPDFSRTFVFLHWRNATRGSAWTTERSAPTPDARGVWFNFIPEANLNAEYQVSISSPIAESESCVYAGDGLRNVCP